MNQRSKRKKNDITDDSKTVELLEKACHQLESVSHARNADKPDDCHIFGLHVAASLRLISDARNRALCKLKIQELLFNFQFEPQRPSEQRTSHYQTHQQPFNQSYSIPEYENM